MAWRKARFRPGRGHVRRTGRCAAAAAVALPLAVGGCNSAVEGWRSLTGVNINDPDPKTAPFTQNLAEAAAAPYPNLASVPPPPTLSMSSAERQKLAQSLIADRSATAADAGPAPAPGTAQPAPVAAAARPAAMGAKPPGPGGATLSPGGMTVATATPTPAPRPPAAGAAPASAQRAPGAATVHRNPNEPPEAAPLNSTLTMPVIPTPLPEPEAARPPPPVPALAALPPTAVPAAPLPAGAATAMPAPAPAVPVLPPVAPPPMPAQKAPKPVPTATTVATLGIASSPVTDAAEQAQIGRVAALYRQKPGGVRVVAYAAPPAGRGDPLAAYHAALDRAQAVSGALTRAGIPANKIQTEASPGIGPVAGKVEIQFIPEQPTISSGAPR